MIITTLHTISIYGWKPLRKCQRSVKVRVWIDDAVGWNLQLLGAFNGMDESKPLYIIMMQLIWIFS